PGVIPLPSALSEFHDITGNKFYNSSDDYDSNENKYRCDKNFSQIQPLLLKPSQREDQNKRSHSVDDTVRTEEHAPVREAPTVYDNFKKHFVDPSDDGAHHKIKIVFCKLFLYVLIHIFPPPVKCKKVSALPASGCAAGKHQSGSGYRKTDLL